MNKLKNNYGLIILFIVSTSFFITQHASLLSWDFSSYVMNTKYLFSNGDYFETYRAPLVPLLLSPTILFGVFAEYIYIIQASIIFLFAVISFSDTIWKIYPSLNNQKKEFVRFIFYITILTPFTIFYATQAGTEILALGFLILFTSEILRKNVSGHILALGFLTRYNLIFFTPLLLLNKNLKKILKNILYFLAIVAIWFTFNYLHFGNFFTSIVDSYALNIYLREPLTEAFNLHAPFEVMGISFIFAIIGIIFTIRNFKKTEQRTIAGLIILIALLIINDYASTPFKITRYLYNLVFPMAFFATIGIATMAKPKIQKSIIIILIFLFTLQSLVLFTEIIKARNYDNQFYNAAKDLKSLGLENCSILSPHWVPVRYNAGGILPLGGHPIEESIAQNITVLIFTKESTIDDKFKKENLKNFPKIYETNDYIFLGNPNMTEKTCAPRIPFDETFIKNHCEILSEKFKSFHLKPLALKTCKIINFE